VLRQSGIRGKRSRSRRWRSCELGRDARALWGPLGILMAACLEIFGLCFLHRKPSRVAGFSGFVDWYGLENDASSELDLAGLTVGSYCGDIERLLNRLPAPSRLSILIRSFSSLIQREMVPAVRSQVEVCIPNKRSSERITPQGPSPRRGIPWQKFRRKMRRIWRPSHFTCC